MKEFKYKFNEEHESLLREQIWECDPKFGGTFQVYHDLAPYEVSQIKEFLPKAPKVVWEMGAGAGRGSIYLNHYYGKNNTIKWWLFDRNGFSEKNTGAFKPKEDEYYNDFNLGKSFCKLNGLKDFQYLDTEKDNWNLALAPDLIFSFCAFGMHTELERYMDLMLRHAKEDITMIFGTRHAGYNGKSFSDKFKEVIFKPSAGDPKFPIENWLILRGKK